MQKEASAQLDLRWYNLLSVLYSLLHKGCSNKIRLKEISQLSQKSTQPLKFQLRKERNMLFEVSNYQEQSQCNHHVFVETRRSKMSKNVYNSERQTRNQRFQNNFANNQFQNSQIPLIAILMKFCIKNKILLKTQFTKRHYQIKHSEICICEEQDTYQHISQCEALQDLVEEFKDFRNYDLLKLLSYNQNYIGHNFPTTRQLQQINLRIKYFHSKLLRRRIQILEQNDEQMEELLKQFIQKADQEEIDQSRLRQDQ